MIDWESRTTEHLVDSSAGLPDLRGHVWISSSGTSKKKYIALSKEAFLISAHAVNHHLDVSSKDIWLQPLPRHHVGGLSIYARAHLSGCKVVDFPDVTRVKWSAGNFYQTLMDSQATMVSIVPAQLHDIVALPPPPYLRAVIVGGAKLEDVLYKKAVDAGWAVIPTYGCSECCSQIATGSLKDSTLTVLPHVEARIDGSLHIKSRSLLTGYFIDGVFIDPKSDGWFDTGDYCELHANTLLPQGRRDRVIKVGGEKVDLDFYERLLDRTRCRLEAIPDERLGYIVGLIALPDTEVEKVVSSYNASVEPFARIRRSRCALITQFFK